MRQMEMVSEKLGDAKGFVWDVSVWNILQFLPRTTSWADLCTYVCTYVSSSV